MYGSVLFDLDGTLIDPSAGTLASLQLALAGEGFSPLKGPLPGGFVGPPLEAAIAGLQPLFAQPLPTQSLLARFREAYAVHGTKGVDWLPGALSMLKNLRRQGVKLFVATSKPTVFAVRSLRHLNAYHLFADVAGCDLVGPHLGKGEIIRGLMQRHHLNPSSCLMVGDRCFDIEGAQQNGMASLGLLHGFGGIAELTSAGATHLAISFADAMRVIIGDAHASAPMAEAMAAP